MTKYAILRTKRLQQKDLNVAFWHNERHQKDRFSRNVDSEKTHLNKVRYFNNFSLENCLAEKAIDEFIKSNKIEVKKSNTVKALEFVLTASPGYWTDEKNLNDWYEANLKFIQTEFGQQLISAHFHQDETTPHFHVVIIPHSEKTYKYKNRYGETTKTKKVLCPSDFDRDYLTNLQTKYAEKMAKFGLKRGKKGSRASHKDLKQFYKSVTVKLNEKEKTIKKYENKIDEIISQNTFLGFLKVKKAKEQLGNTLLNKLERVLTTNANLELKQQKFSDNQDLRKDNKELIESNDLYLNQLIKRIQFCF